VHFELLDGHSQIGILVDRLQEAASIAVHYKRTHMPRAARYVCGYLLSGSAWP